MCAAWAAGLPASWALRGAVTETLPCSVFRQCDEIVAEDCVSQPVITYLCVRGKGTKICACVHVCVRVCARTHMLMHQKIHVLARETEREETLPSGVWSRHTSFSISPSCQDLGNP